MEFLHKNQNAIALIVILGAAFYVYSTFFAPDSSVVSGDVTAEQVGNEVLNLSNRLQSVTLDQSLFSSSLYRRLIDFSTSIPDQPTGRPNPFNEIGRD